MPTEHLFHYPVAILCLLGVFYWFRYSYRTHTPLKSGDDLKLVTLLFVCVFLPMVVSLTDAFNFGHALKTTISYIHFLPAALYITVVCRDVESRPILLKTVGIMLGVLVIDALIQFFTGTNLLGYSRDSVVLTGIFDANQRLGLVLALFLPLVLYGLHTRHHWGWWKWSFLVPYAVVVLLSLKRSAWVMLIVGAGLYVLCFIQLSTVSWRTKMLVPLCAAAVGLAVAYFVPSVGKTLDTTIGAMSADFETLDIATSRRLTLWDTGKNIAQSHPINGVGPRGYRYAYKHYAEQGDFWIEQNGKGQTHPHLMGLEVLVETGLIGLCGLMLFLYLLTQNMFRRARSEPLGAIWLALALVAWFPLNTHLAFYGSYWSTFAWLFIAIGASNSAQTQSYA